MNFEDVDAHVKGFGALPTVSHDPKVAAAQLCTYYKAAKPILMVFVSLPFIPATWKSVLTGLLGVLDVLCP